MKNNINEVVEEFFKKGIIYTHKWKWNLALHYRIMNKFKDKNYSQYHHINNYIDSMLFFHNDLQLELITQWLTNLKITECKNHEEKNSLISLLRRAIELFIIFDEHSMLKKSLSKYIINQQLDYLSKKQREKFIQGADEHLNKAPHKLVKAILKECLLAKENGKRHILKDKELKLILLIESNAIFDERLFHDRKTGEIWCVDSTYKIHYFNGVTMAKDPLKLTMIENDFVNQLNEIYTIKSDKQWLFWSGINNFNYFKLYWNTLIYYKSKYYTERDEALVNYRIVFEALSIEEVENIINVFAEHKKSNKFLENTFFCPERGLIFRQYKQNKYANSFDLSVYKHC